MPLSGPQDPNYKKFKKRTLVKGAKNADSPKYKSKVRRHRNAAAQQGTHLDVLGNVARSPSRAVRAHSRTPAPAIKSRCPHSPAAARSSLRGHARVGGAGRGAGQGGHYPTTWLPPQVKVHYIGKLEDGTVFDDTLPKNKGWAARKPKGARALKVKDLIPGWAGAMMKMTTGETARLTLPPEGAYGAKGKGNVIPPNATLIFDVELVAIL